MQFHCMTSDVGVPRSLNNESGVIFSSPFKIMYTSIKSPLILLISNVVRFNVINLLSVVF